MDISVKLQIETLYWNWSCLNNFKIIKHIWFRDAIISKYNRITCKVKVARYSRVHIISDVLVFREHYANDYVHTLNSKWVLLCKASQGLYAFVYFWSNRLTLFHEPFHLMVKPSYILFTLSHTYVSYALSPNLNLNFWDIITA